MTSALWATNLGRDTILFGNRLNVYYLFPVLPNAHIDIYCPSQLSMVLANAQGAPKGFLGFLERCMSVRAESLEAP